MEANINTSRMPTVEDEHSLSFEANELITDGGGDETMRSR